MFSGPFKVYEITSNIYLMRLHISTEANVPQFRAAAINGNFTVLELKLQ